MNLLHSSVINLTDLTIKRKMKMHTTPRKEENAPISPSLINKLDLMRENSDDNLIKAHREQPDQKEHREQPGQKEHREQPHQT